MQVSQLIVYYTPKKGLPCAFFLITRSSKAEEESFLRQVLLSDLRLDTWVETNKNMNDIKLKCGCVLI